MLVIPFLAGAVFLIGPCIVKLSRHPEETERFSMGMAFGALTGLFIFDLGSEVAEAATMVGFLPVLLSLIFGYGILRLLDRFVPNHESAASNGREEHTVHIGTMAAFALILHNLLEGATIYSLALLSWKDSALFALGVSLHNIPMSILLGSVLERHYTRKRLALFGAVTLSTFVGALIIASVHGLLTETVMAVLVSSASGMVLFLIFKELLPHIIRMKPVRTVVLSVIVGWMLVLAGTLLA